MAHLNLDVLREICGFLTDVPDVLSFSLTCSTLRAAAVERRLSMRDITIWSAESIRDLYNFIFVDENRRGRHIQAITIPVHSDIPPEPSEELINALVSVLASATRARRFSFYFPVPDEWSATEGSDELEVSCLFCHRKILSAVAEMVSLHELRVVAQTDIAGYFLQSTRSTLKVFWHGDVDGDSHEQFPVTVAPQLIPALQEIALTFELFEFAMTSTPCMSLPAVRSVTLTDVFEPFKLDMLLTAFPNLDDTLIIADNLYTFNNGHLRRSREENREAQKRYTWKALDRVAASAVMLYALGLTCPVRHLTLNPAPVLNPRRPQATGNAGVALRESASSRFALLGLRLPLGNSILGGSLFVADTVARLTHLVLEARYMSPPGIVATPGWETDSEEEDNMSWDDILDTLVAGVDVLRLTHIHIVVSCDVESSWGPFSTAIYDGTRHFSFDRLLTALPNAMPSLTYIVITSSGLLCNIETNERETWRTCRAWRVRRPPVGIAESLLESHELEELSSMEGEALINKEELNGTTKAELHRWKTVEILSNLIVELEVEVAKGFA
ncbi:hypothetical protein GSI_05131 [Ganoderma sinense ZZ0214-1]|uniref:F-box domain-containing protein n=1 Tax=Ganoderma sinense ZZ0214-1 TaxID=1077348 RepID=A0A2G8SF89_9APHY|nr:hypothetical protein GSI_05131 [Ganoderma sinense ZZ0214-1]